MTRLTLYVPEGTWESDELRNFAFAELEEMIVERFGGFTVVRAHGAWQGSTQLFCETTHVYTILTDKPLWLLPPLGYHIKAVWEQEAVLVTVEEDIEAIFY